MITEKKLELIADKAALFHLNQFTDVSAYANEVKRLLQRKIDGDKPSAEEWKTIANDDANANATISFAFAYAITNANGFANGFANAYDDTNANTIANADHIIDLLGDDLIAYPDLNKKVLAEINMEGNRLFMGSWHEDGICGTTHCRAGWEIVIHPDGWMLEKYFGPWMAATIIHKKSTGETVDYYAEASDVMRELRSA